MQNQKIPLEFEGQSGSGGVFQDPLWSPVRAGAGLAMIILFSACMPILYLWDRSGKALEQEIQQSLLETTRSAALLINGDLHTTFISPDNEQEKGYLLQMANLRRFMTQNARLASLCTYVLRDDTIYIVLDTARSKIGDGNIVRSNIMDIQSSPSKKVTEAFQQKRPVVDTKPRSSRRGTFVSGYAPVYDSKDNVIAIIGADLSVEELAASKSAIQRSALAGLGLAVLCSLFAGLGVFTLRRKALTAKHEAKIAHHALRAVEFQYQNLFEQIPIGVIYFNDDLIVTDCNERILEIGGVDRDGLMGMNLTNLQEGRLLPCLKDALQNRESVYVGEYNITRDAKKKWVEIHAGPIKNSSGHITGGIATIEDITFRHQAEMLSEAEKLLLGMIARGDSLNDVLLQLVESIESLMPESICSVCLLAKDRKHLLRGIAPNLPPEFLDSQEGLAIGPGAGSCGTAAYTGKPVFAEDIKHDSNWTDFKATALHFGIRSCWSMPIMSGPENIYGTVAVYHHYPYKPNVFERALLENAKFLAGIAVERSLFEAAIFEERNLLRTLIDHIPDVIFIKDRHHKYLAANRAAFDRLDVNNKATLIGRTDYDILPAKIAAANHEVEQRILDGQAEIDIESVVTDASGNVQFISTSRLPLRNSDGNIIGLVTIGRDVTDRKRIEEERIKSQKLDSLGILAGGIAHDFNNILTSVLSNLSYVNASGKSLDAECGEMLKEAETSTHRAKELTQQLLTFAKGGMPVKKALNIATLLKEAATFATSGSACKLDFDIPEELWMADIDGGQISQVIQNLLFNANEAMPGGGTINISSRNMILEKGNTKDLPSGRYIAVSIKDHGHGIPDNIRERIFDPYFTTKKAGNGLGLTTTFSIIKKHGGHISVESIEGNGATFTFLLPAVAESEIRHAKDKHAQQKSKPAHVLIMDDEIAILKISSRILERAGFKVSLAQNGEEAVRAFKNAFERNQPVDIVILDLTIPGGMGGKETLEQLKAIDPQIKAVVSSGYSMDEIMARHEIFGFAGVVSKPYSQEELISAIKAALSATMA